MPPRRRQDAQFVFTGDGIPLINGVPQFASEEVYAAYMNYFTNAPVHRARGLDLTNCGPVLFNLIEQYHWRDVVAPPGQVNVDLVREFYAYLRVHPYTNVVHVRGKPVIISPGTLNHHFGLDIPEEEPEYTVLFDGSDAWLADVGAFLGIQWTIGDIARTFEEPDFRQWEHKCLHRLIRSNLLPAKHVSTVYYAHATLLYWMCMGWPVNVGALMRTEMTADALKRRHTLPYGSLITALCEAAECPLLGSDSYVTPMPILSLDSVPPPAVQAGDPDQDDPPFQDFGPNTDEAGPSNQPLPLASFDPNVETYDPNNPRFWD